MAFSDETKRLKICEVLGITAIQLGIQLDAFSEHLTAAIEARVDLQLDRWFDADEGVGEDFDRIEPNQKNFGLGNDPESERQDIRQKIYRLLFWTDETFAQLAGGAASDSFIVERG